MIGAIFCPLIPAKGVDLNRLFNRDEDAAVQKELDEILAEEADLAKVKPNKEDQNAMADWEAKGRSSEVAFLGDATAAAEAALAAVEPVIDAFFTPPEDMPLVTEADDVVLPLRDHLNPKNLEAIVDFADKCVKPVLGADKATLTRLDWKKVKAAFAPYRAWAGSKPVMNAGVIADLEDKERVCRYRLHLVEFLENYVNMKRLYDENDLSIFQTGVLRIDAKEMNLCFHVADEGAHSALAAKSDCCIVYLKLSRPSEGATAQVCAVVTAGAIAQLYVGRNGVFFDRDGKDWEAVITKVVESQVSLAEAFWAPWKKLGEGIAGAVKKFLGDKQSKATENVQKGTESTQAGGAAMASSVAAVGIGIGMVGAALAGLMSAISAMVWWQLLIAVVAVILVVSLPSVILTWFKLRRRDIGAVLNASGWAINRPMYFSMKRARGFTKCARGFRWGVLFGVLAVVALLVAGGIWYCRAKGCCCGKAAEAPSAAPAAEAAPAAPAAPAA